VEAAMLRVRTVTQSAAVLMKDDVVCMFVVCGAASAQTSGQR
jgi:hypothetical protein